MANEFVIKNGFISNGNGGILGNLNVTGNTNISGNTFITSGLTATTISATRYENLPAPDLSNYVPYTGATQDVDLGTFSLSANNLTNNVTKYNTTYSITGNEPQGAVYWNADRQTLQLKMNGTNYDYGMGLYFYIKNQSGVQINKGDVVGFAGTLGMSGIILGAKYVNDGSQPSDRLMGVAKENIPNGDEGKVVFFGEVRGINTNGFPAGTILYASNFTAGGLSSTIPFPKTNKGEIAAVITESSTVGTIFVRALINKNIEELNNVNIFSPIDGQALVYDANGLWKNKTIISGTTGYIPKFNSDNTIEDSVIFQSGSSIGIGTETPTQVLDVNGNVRFRRSGTTTFTIGGGQSAATSQDGIINIVSSLNDNLILDTRRASGPRIYSTNRTLEISSPNATNILLKPVTTGNIGIGTSNPTFKLDVSGSTRITDDLIVEGNIIKDVKIITGDTYTLLNTDRNKILHFTSNTDVVITIPTGLNPNNRYEGKQLGTGQLLFGTDMGVDLRVGASELAKTAEQYSVFGLDVIGPEEYLLFGKLELI